VREKAFVFASLIKKRESACRKKYFSFHKTCVLSECKTLRADPFSRSQWGRLFINREDFPRLTFSRTQTGETRCSSTCNGKAVERERSSNSRRCFGSGDTRKVAKLQSSDFTAARGFRWARSIVLSPRPVWGVLKVLSERKRACSYFPASWVGIRSEELPWKKVRCRGWAPAPMSR